MAAEGGTGPERGAISLAAHETRLEGCVEVARLWVKDKGPATFLIDGRRLSSPEMFGMLMTDCVRTAAEAYARSTGLTEGETLRRIWQGLDAERARDTTDNDQTGGSLN